MYQRLILSLTLTGIHLEHQLTKLRLNGYGSYFLTFHLYVPILLTTLMKMGFMGSLPCE